MTGVGEKGLEDNPFDKKLIGITRNSFLNGIVTETVGDTDVQVAYVICIPLFEKRVNQMHSAEA